MAVKPNKSSKQQALETIGKLKETLPIERAQMRMKVITPIRFSQKHINHIHHTQPPRFNNKIRKQLSKLGSACTVESEDKIDDTMALVILVDPGKSEVEEMLLKYFLAIKSNLN